MKAAIVAFAFVAVSGLAHDGVEYAPGDGVPDLPEADADRLLAAGVIKHADQVAPAKLAAPESDDADKGSAPRRGRPRKSDGGD